MSDYQCFSDRAAKVIPKLCAEGGPASLQAVSIINDLVEVLLASEREVLEQARLNGAGAERELLLHAQLAREKEGVGSELQGLAVVNGNIVQVGRATREVDHGKSFWRCQAYPPHGRLFESVATEQEAMVWIKDMCRAECIIWGVLH